ncbi:uncharacterized protein LOC130743831 [Lotus japonicus]|uniref:uncharacterized protein LOC130743831 n=1 Tax=Lotus japonicus TaxID=34305 RepID=UPI0025858252|nr:uncharacterized protein LOC130743831 [Lotus japonicus]
MSWNAVKTRIGCGVCVLDVADRWLLGASESYGTGTSFMAELLAVELGLLVCWDLGLRQVACYTDFSYVRDVLQEEVSSEHFWARDVIQRVRSLLRRDWRISVRVIPREKNTAADSLALQVA